MWLYEYFQIILLYGHLLRSVLHFKGLGMRTLQYEMRISLKSHNKVTKTVYIWFECLWIIRYCIDLLYKTLENDLHTQQYSVELIRMFFSSICRFIFWNPRQFGETCQWGLPTQPILQHNRHFRPTVFRILVSWWHSCQLLRSRVRGSNRHQNK